MNDPCFNERMRHPIGRNSAFDDVMAEGFPFDPATLARYRAAMTRKGFRGREAAWRVGGPPEFEPREGTARGGVDEVLAHDGGFHGTYQTFFPVAICARIGYIVDEFLSNRCRAQATASDVHGRIGFARVEVFRSMEEVYAFHEEASRSLGEAIRPLVRILEQELDPHGCVQRCFEEWQRQYTRALAVLEERHLSRTGNTPVCTANLAEIEWMQDAHIAPLREAVHFIAARIASHDATAAECLFDVDNDQSE